eukprot:m51a1_g7446 hypothetical protein (89) ;mRNA; r:99223-99489
MGKRTAWELLVDPEPATKCARHFERDHSPSPSPSAVCPGTPPMNPEPHRERFVVDLLLDSDSSPVARPPGIVIVPPRSDRPLGFAAQC